MAAEPLPLGREQPRLQARVRALRDEYAALWSATPAELPAFGPAVGFCRHFTNARAAGALIDDLGRETRRMPEGEEARREWRAAVRERLQRFGDARLGWPRGYRSLFFGDAFFAAAVAFAREARAFAPQLSLDDLWQALRNVWIANSLQMLRDLPVRLTPGLFAYSMLYPLTDNVLDDPRLTDHAKLAFSERIGRRLAGLAVAPSDGHDAAVFRLLRRIEDEAPRGDLTHIHESLLAIYCGQARSLRQQSDPTLTDAEILTISCEKGGSSLLPDLYLAGGGANLAEERFAFGYGVFLQLLDDLQDVESDLAAGHQTLFTRAAQRGPLDRATARLARFIDRVLDEGEVFAGPTFDDRKDLIRRNCRALLVGVVAEHPHRFRRRFRRTLSRHWPLSLRALRRLRRRAAASFREAENAQGGRRLSLLDRVLTETGDL